MKIVETKTAPNPRRVRIFLAEKSISVPYENRDLLTLKEADFSALNGEHRVPVLVLDDGTVIAETVAICRYFEELHPQPALFGAGPLQRAQVEMWNRRVELGLFNHVAQVFRHLHPSMSSLEVPQIAAWGEANKPKALDALGRIDRQLADHRYIAGDAYSIADITLLVAIDFMRSAKLARPPEFTNVARWYGEVSARPSAKA